MVIKVNYKIVTIVLAGILLFSLFEMYPRTASAPKSGVLLPIILYHNVLESKDIRTRYAVTPDDFESDLKYIKEHGYTTILMDDLIRYVSNGTALPEKPIILTFDDGLLNTYVYAYPLLKKYDMKAVVSIIGRNTDIFSNIKSDSLIRAHLSWDQINEMKDSGCFEIQNHSYALHTTSKGRYGARIMPDESLEHYEEALTEDIGGFQREIAEKTGYTPTTFAYPFGRISRESFGIIRKLGFRASLSTDGGINIITGDPDGLFSLKRNDRSHGITSQAFFKVIYEISGLKCSE